MANNWWSRDEDEEEEGGLALLKKLRRNAHSATGVSDYIETKTEPIRRQKAQEQRNKDSAEEVKDLVRGMGDYLTERKAVETPQPVKRERNLGPNALTPEMEYRHQQASGGGNRLTPYQVAMQAVMSAAPKQEETRSTDELRREMNRQNRWANATTRMAADMGNQLSRNQGLMYDPVYTSNLRTMGRTMEAQQAKAAAATNLYQTISTQRRAEEEREKYASLMQNPDFAAKSQGDPTIGNKVSSTSLAPAERLYQKIFHRNDTKDANGNIKDAAGSDAARFVNDEEAAIFYYLWNTQGAKAAQSYYYGYVENRAGERRAQLAQQQAQAYGEYDPVGASIASIGYNAVSGIGLVDMAFQNLARALGITDRNKPLNYNNDAQLIGQVSDALRSGAGSFAEQFATDEIKRIRPNVKHPENYAKVASFLYQTGMSMADSSVAIALNLMGVPEPLTLAMMGTAAGTRAIRDARERGATDGQALAFGFSSAIMEALFEKISLDRILEPSYAQTTKAHLLNALKQSFTEGSEEVMTTLANTAADMLIMGDKAELYAIQRQLMEQGVSEKEALGAAFKQWGTGIVGDLLGGMISGFGMGGAKEVGTGLGVFAQGVRQDVQTARALTDYQNAQPAAPQITPQQTPAAPVQQRQLTAREQSPLRFAMNKAQNGETVTGNDAKAILNDPQAVQTLRDAGVLADTIRPGAEGRAQIQQAVQALAEQNQQETAQERTVPPLPRQMAQEQQERVTTPPVPQNTQNAAQEATLRLRAQEEQAPRQEQASLSVKENAPAAQERQSPLTIRGANATVEENRQEENYGQGQQTETAAAAGEDDFRARAETAAEGARRSYLDRIERSSGLGRVLQDLRNYRIVRGAESRASEVSRIRNQAEAGNQRDVSALDYGIANGSAEQSAKELDNATASRVLGRNWDRAVAELARQGVTLKAMTGQLKKEDGTQIRAFFSGDGKTIVVQADHPKLSWNQLLDHEDLHRRIKADRNYRKAVEDALLADRKLQAYLPEIIDRYARAYAAADPGLSSDDVIEELLADYRAGFDMLDPLGMNPITARAAKRAAKDIKGAEKTLRKQYETNGGKPAPADIEENFAEAKNSVEPPYRRGTAALTQFEESLSPEARKTYDLFNTLNNISRSGTAEIWAGSGKARHLKWDTIADKSFFAKDWNNYVKTNKEFAAIARELVAALPDSVKKFGNFNDDGTVTPTEFEEKFKMNRSFIQRVVDALPKNVVQPVMNIDGHEYRISDKPISGAVGGEEYRQAIIAEKRRLYKEGNLPTVSTGSLSHDNWGAMGFLATNTKTGASGDFTTFCPQMYFNNGCFYCYRRAALTSGSNNKLTGETVWYSGEILQLRPSDVEDLNKKGGLRIQSFGDWQDMYTPMLADMLYDAQMKGLQIKIITKEPSMIETVAKLRQQALGLSLYFNLSADYTIERRGESDNRETKKAAPLNAERPFIEHEWLTGEPGEDIGWKRALTVQEANEYRKKYSWVNTRIVATTLKEYIRGLIDPTVDVVTGYHGKIKYQERVSSETGETLIEVEALGDSGMPQFVRDEKTGEWSIARDKEGKLLNGKNRYQKALCDAIIARGLQEAYYTKACCITGHCEKCQGQCGAYANKMSTKNARNRDPDNLRWVYAQMEMHPGAGMENSQLFAENLEDTEGLTQAEDLVDIYDREHGIEPLQEKPVEQQLAERDKWLKKKDREAAKKAAKAAAEKAGATPAQVEANEKYSTEVNTLTYFSGGGLVDHALRDVIGSSMAVEYDKGAAAVYALNNGDVFVGDVRDFSKNELDKMKDIDYFHASPVCKNYSRMNTRRTDVSDNDTDITTAQATADAIRRLMPKVFTLEQVPGYKGSKAYNIIADTLTELGYAWDDTVAKASDYGGATSRERLMLRAVRDGALPALPEKVKGYSWFEATADLIDGLNTADRISPFLQERINATPELQRALANQTEPILILGGTPGGKAWWASADEPSPSITTDMTDSRIIMPDGTVKKPDARFYARIMGLPDSYQFTQYRGKDNQTQGQKVIGNGVPVQLTQKFFGNLLDDALDTGVKYSTEIDTDYMSAVESGDMETAQRMVDEAAKESGVATNSKGRPIHLYHGTPHFGFTVFKDGKYEVPFIYTSTDRTVSAHYAGDQNYAFPRAIGKKYKAGDSTEDIIANARSVYDSNYHVMTAEEKARIYEEVRRDAVAVADRIDELALDFMNSERWNEIPNEIVNAMSWTEDMFFTVRDSDYGYSFEEDDGYRKEWQDQMDRDIENFEENRNLVREYYAEHRDDLGEKGKKLFSYLLGFELGDTAIDIQYKMRRVAEEADVIINEAGNINDPAELKRAMDVAHEIGAYELYGNLGERPFVFDANGAQFWGLKVPEIGEGTYSTDTVCKWAYEHGYTSVVMKNIYDYGDKADNYVFFDSSQLKSADPITYDNDGNIIPLSERFNPADMDIRYSVEIDPDVAKQFSMEGIEEREVQSLLRENEELKKKLKDAKAQIKTSDRTQPREEDVRRMTRDLLKAYSSKADGNQVNESLRELAHTVMSNDARWTDIRDQAVRLAGKILEESSVLVGDDAELNREIRNAIRKEKIAYTNNGNIPDYGQWRKDNFGKLKIAKDGLPMETRWEELQDTYGKGYFPDDIKNPADQIVYLSELYDRLQDVYENPYNQNMAEATEFLANDIIDRVISGEMRQAPTTYADRAETRLARETLRGELREQKIKERLEAERERRKEQIAELKEHYKGKEAKGRESRKSKELRTKIINHAKQMTTELLKPTDKKHVPESLRKSVAAVLSAIDLGSGYDMTAGQNGNTLRVGRGTEGAEQTKRTKAFLELKEALMKEADGLVLDPELLGTVEEPGSLTRLVTELADVPIANMNTEQLQVVYDALRGIEGALKSANRMLSSARWAAVGEAADAIRSENGNKGPVLQLAGAAGRAQDLTRLDMLTPEGYFHRLGKSGQAVFKMLRGAQDQFITNMTKATNDTQKIVGDTDVGALEKEKHTVTMGGEKVTMTTAQIMELYCLMQRDQGLQHITTGGIMVEPVRQGIKQTTQAEPLHPSMEELLDAVRLLTPEEVRLATAMQDYLSKDMAELGNEATLAVYGYKKFGQESKYWKIRSNKNEIQQSIEKETQTTSVANRGFTKAVNPQANTSVKIGSIFDTYSQSVNDMATYAAWLAVGEDVNRIRNYVFRDSEGQRTGTVKGILDRVIGSGGANYLQRLLADIANGAGMDDAGLTSGFVGAYKAAAIGANIRVIIQQPTAILRAAEMIDPKYLAAGLKNPMKSFERAKEYSPIAQWKDWGYFDINTGRKMKDVLFESSSKLEKVRQASMAMAGKADSFAWGQLWGAVEAETKDKTDLKPGTKEFYQACAERFNDIIDHTQVVDGILQRSQIMRSKNAITRMAVSFMSEPTKQYNQFMSAVYDYRHSGDKKQAKQMLARTTFSMLAAGVMNVLAQSIVDALRNGDRERKYWEKLLQAFLGYNPDDDTFGEKFKTFAFSNMGELINPATYLPYAKDIMSIIQGYSVERMDMDGLSDTITAITKLAKALNGEGKQTVGYSLGKAVEQGAKLLGLSAYNVDRDLTALITTIANDADMPVLQYYLNRYRYRPGDNLSKELKGILWDARQKNDGSYDIIVEHLLKDGYTQEQIDTAVMNRLSDESGFTEARKAADAEGNNNGSYDLSETLEALENTTLSEEDRDVLLEAKLSDKQYGNYTTLLQYSDYDTWLSVMREMPANLSQAKIEAVLDKRDDLTTKQKAAYWQVLSGSTSTKNNPYSQEVGAEILNAKAENQPDKEPEKVAQMRTTLSGLGLQDSKVDALAPVLGGDGTNTSKWRAVANQNLGKDQQDAVLKSVMTDAMYRNWTIASGENISLDSYVKGREAYVDLDNSGTDQNSEWTAALEKVTFDKDTTRNNYIKGVLWQIYTGSTSTKNNPFDKTGGQKVLDAKGKGGGKGTGSNAPARIPTLRLPEAPRVEKPSSGLRIRDTQPSETRQSSGLRLPSYTAAPRQSSGLRIK